MYNMQRVKLSVKTLVDQVRNFNYFQLIVFHLGFKLNISKKIQFTTSLQDHRMQMYLNISRKTKFMKNFKFLKYSVYRHLMTHYTLPTNRKSIGSLKAKI